MYSNRGWSYSPVATRSATSAYRRRRLRLPRLPAFSPLPVAVLLVGAVAWYHFGFGGFNVRGSVVDASTAQPIVDARVWTSRGSSLSAANGSFELDRVKPPDAVGFDAPGYRPQSLRVVNPLEALASPFPGVAPAVA